MERKLKPEVGAKYELKKVLPGEIVIGAKVYDFRTMTLKQADEFYSRHHALGYLVLKEVAKEDIITTPAAEVFNPDVTAPEKVIDPPAAEIIVPAVSNTQGNSLSDKEAKDYRPSRRRRR